MIGVYSLSLLALVARRLGRNLTGFGDEPKLDGLARMATIRRIGRTEPQKRFSESFTGTTGFDDYTALYESHLHGRRARVRILRFLPSGAASSDSDGDA
jgi:hypothetical protein